MRELVTQIPDVEAFLALAPEELAAKMLFLLRQRRQDMFTAGSLETELWGGIGGAPGASYPSLRQGDVHLAFAEAWAWLEAQGLLVPAEAAPTVAKLMYGKNVRVVMSSSLSETESAEVEKILNRARKAPPLQGGRGNPRRSKC